MANEGLASHLAFLFYSRLRKYLKHKLPSCVFSVQYTITLVDTSLYCLTPPYVTVLSVMDCVQQNDM
jgi:hypothetical protein